MEYYNREYERLVNKQDIMKYLNEGGCGEVFHDDKKILKVYYPETNYSHRISPLMFDILKEVNNPHFIELFDIYRGLSLKELLEARLGLGYHQFIIEAYTAKYYSDDTVNPLWEQKDYILENFRELELLFDEFTHNRIITNDIRRPNCILSPERIIIIDPDQFDSSKNSQEEIAIENKKRLLGLFTDICIFETVDKHHSKELSEKIRSKPIEIEIMEKTDVTQEISKMLKYVKKPIDYFLK